MTTADFAAGTADNLVGAVRLRPSCGPPQRHICAAITAAGRRANRRTPSMQNGKRCYFSRMQATLIIFMVVAAVATLAVLARGIIIMARGQDTSGEQSNRMMSLRVALQALAILFIVILFLINRPG